MWFYLAAILVVIVSLGAAASVAARKFPQLTLIDTEALPLERDAKKKKAIIHDRASRMTAAFGRRIAAALTRWFERRREGFRRAYRKVLALERQYRKEKPVSAGEAEARIAALSADAERLFKAGEYGDAEKKYIEILSFDRRNVDATWGLGTLYLESKRYDQAKETYAYLARMLRKAARCVHAENGTLPQGRTCAADAASHADIAACYLDLGIASQAAGDKAQARAAFERAVAFEPANPRHLDLLLDECILEGDKSRASEVFAQLRAANPENNKLDALAERIASLPDPVAAPKKGKQALPRW
ncbi:MAG TPA: tetratricopeptide repeat protein [Candidatus Binatia bacterium]|jgi:tetratricopeptide (TPR) repeat protein|nr:tetratricopeptide repeat protein [Candidatus Binatia bacterium]